MYNIFINLNGELRLRGYIYNDPKPDLGNASVGKLFSLAFLKNFFLGGTKMKNNGIRFITEMGIFIALGLVFDYLANLFWGYVWPAGGSISIAMLPIFMMSLRYGIKGGITSGILIGTTQILWAQGLALAHPAQIVLDYSLAYGLVGLAGLLARTIDKETNQKLKLLFLNLSVLIGGLLRLIIHIISGYIFFMDHASGTPKYLLWFSSTTYNASYIIPSIVLCMIFLTIISIKYSYLVKYEQ